MQTANTELKLIYEGSVKRVYAPVGDEHHLWFHFTDDYSVFDWGKMPDTIANKGLALTLMGAYFFQVMEAKGIGTHFKRLVLADGESLTLEKAAVARHPVYMEVVKADVHRYERAQSGSRWQYQYKSDPRASRIRFVPLEVVFRFGIPKGSSLLEVLEKDPSYAAKLGLGKVPKEGEWLERPILQFFTKLEAKDRLLDPEEARSIACLSQEEFDALQDLALESAKALFDVFKSRGIELWDGKFEFIMQDGEFMLADSIGPDELRLIYKGVHLSKEIIRQIYRGTPWELALKKAQSLAKERGTEDFKQICRDELHQQPDRLPADFKEKIDHLYAALTNHLTDRQLLPQEPDLETLVNSLSR